MNRQEYLQKKWAPYPAMPKDSVAAGRIFQMEQKTSHWLLVLIRDQKKVQIEFQVKPELAEVLQEGDLVAVKRGPELVLLAPQLKSLPSRNYNRQQLHSWNQFMGHLKDFFFGKEFIEVRTPSLVVCPGTEPSLDVFSTDFKNGSDKRKFFLPTSPELHLKKTLALGAEKIFEIAPCFRNGEVTEIHQPEFLMLEWYRAYDDLAQIKQDVVDLVQTLAAKMHVPAPKHIRSASIPELFEKYCGFSLKPDTSLEELKALAQKLGVHAQGASSIDDYFFLIFLEKIENHLPQDELIFVEKYPPYQAALARLTADGWGDRFEVYWRGMELGNAFHELNDPKIQRLRTSEDLDKKQSSGKEMISVDEEFFACLDAGMPPSGGIAVGVERLYLALMNKNKLADLRVFPLN